MKPKTKPTSNRQIPLIVTTAHKGVFFGYGEPTTDNIIRIERAQMCVSWSADVRGVVGLAANGPTNGCRIGPPCPAITLRDVTSIMEVSPEAVEKWTQKPWN